MGKLISLFELQQHSPSRPELTYKDPGIRSSEVQIYGGHSNRPTVPSFPQPKMTSGRAGEGIPDCIKVGDRAFSVASS